MAVYLGNPSAHNLSASLYGRVVAKALGTRNVYSASTVDQYPKQMASALMFGSGFAVPVPDVDRTDLLLILGANPAASNGSLMTAPDMRGRLKAIRARGGRVIVVDPRSTAHGQAGRRAPPDPPGHRCAAAVRAWCRCWSPRASSTSERPRSTARAWTR